MVSTPQSGGIFDDLYISHNLHDGHDEWKYQKEECKAKWEEKKSTPEKLDVFVDDLITVGVDMDNNLEKSQSHP